MSEISTLVDLRAHCVVSYVFYISSCKETHVYPLLIHNPNRDALDIRHIQPWRDSWKNPLGVYTSLANLPDGSSTNMNKLMEMSFLKGSDVRQYVMPWLEATGFIKRNYDEITVLSVPEFRVIPDVSQLFRSVHHIDRKPLPEDAGELRKLRRRFSPWQTGEDAYQFYLANYDKDSVDVPMLGFDEHKLRGILCELQASGLVNTFATPDKFIYPPWDTPKENAEDAVANWLKSPDAEPAAHLEPKSTDPKWKRFLNGYKAMARHLGIDVHDRRDDVSHAKKLMKEHKQDRYKVYMLAAHFLLNRSDFAEDLAFTISRFGYSFRTFRTHVDAIAADYETKQYQLYKGKKDWPQIELAQEGFDYKTEFKDW
jgi:hypothetical protein